MPIAAARPAVTNLAVRRRIAFPPGFYRVAQKLPLAVRKILVIF
jgi:hypothetical protein